jgi:hypothetical protein
MSQTTKMRETEMDKDQLEIKLNQKEEESRIKARKISDLIFKMSQVRARAPACLDQSSDTLLRERAVQPAASTCLCACLVLRGQALGRDVLLAAAVLPWDGRAGRRSDGAGMRRWHAAHAQAVVVVRLAGMQPRVLLP